MSDQKNTAVEDKSTPTLAMIGGGESFVRFARYELEYKAMAFAELWYRQVVWEVDVSDDCGSSRGRRLTGICCVSRRESQRCRTRRHGCYCELNTNTSPEILKLTELRTFQYDTVSQLKRMLLDQALRLAGPLPLVR